MSFKKKLLIYAAVGFIDFINAFTWFIWVVLLISLDKATGWGFTSQMTLTILFFIFVPEWYVTARKMFTDQIKRG